MGSFANYSRRCVRRPAAQPAVVAQPGAGLVNHRHSRAKAATTISADMSADEQPDLSDPEAVIDQAMEKMFDPENLPEKLATVLTNDRLIVASSFDQLRRHLRDSIERPLSASSDYETMLKALKHRGPDSTGFALYGNPMSDRYVMRFKVAEQEEARHGFDIRAVMKQRKAHVDERMAELGARITDE
ncbi:MAG: hypothetical protein HC927_05470, partial [Deltaproteobacteria bacterium]|nr:hypothetical protein [Deltaproteobacteria bacterium]